MEIKRVLKEESEEDWNDRIVGVLLEFARPFRSGHRTGFSDYNIYHIHGPHLGLYDDKLLYALNVSYDLTKLDDNLLAFGVFELIEYISSNFSQEDIERLKTKKIEFTSYEINAKSGPISKKFTDIDISTEFPLDLITKLRKTHLIGNLFNDDYVIENFGLEGVLPNHVMIHNDVLGYQNKMKQLFKIYRSGTFKGKKYVLPDYISLDVYPYEYNLQDPNHIKFKYEMSISPGRMTNENYDGNLEEIGELKDFIRKQFKRHGIFYKDMNLNKFFKMAPDA